VRIVPKRLGDDGIMYSEVPILIAGRHRLEAVRMLGWDEIPVIVSDGTEIEAKMWEIAENLHRADLTVMERSER
jgi:ParB-like chromosome segregation protein Spo0J